MAPSTRLPTVISPSQENGDHENRPYDYSDFRLLHDVFRQRAADPIQKPLMAFPKSPRGVADFEYHTGKDLDQYTDEAAWAYTKANMVTVCKIHTHLHSCLSNIESNIGLTNAFPYV